MDTRRAMRMAQSASLASVELRSHQNKRFIRTGDLAVMLRDIMSPDGGMKEAGIYDATLLAVAACGYSEAADKEKCLRKLRVLIEDLERASALDRPERSRLEYFAVTLSAHLAFGPETLKNLRNRS